MQLRPLDGFSSSALAEVRSRFAVGTQVGPPRGDSAPDLAELVHDLKNPLATIALEMVLLDEALATEGRAALRESVRRISHNLEFLDRMVQDLLDSSAIDDGELTIQRRTTELRTLLEQVIERTVPARDRTRVFLEATAALTVSVDDLRIERVVGNLLSNALKYAPRASGVVVRLDAMPGVARVSVTDTGPGLTAAEQIYVFDKYRRTADARASEGNGLGLHVSKKIIEAHGGTIGVDSVHGFGSRFYFELPTTAT